MSPEVEKFRESRGIKVLKRYAKRSIGLLLTRRYGHGKLFIEQRFLSDIKI
jgi:hypothetical protein